MRLSRKRSKWRWRSDYSKFWSVLKINLRTYSVYKEDEVIDIMETTRGSHYGYCCCSIWNYIFSWLYNINEKWINSISLHQGLYLKKFSASTTCIIPFKTYFWKLVKILFKCCRSFSSNCFTLNYHLIN